MKIRIIQKPNYKYVARLQVKRWWWPFWTTLYDGDHDACVCGANNLMKNGRIETLLFEGEAKQ